MIRVNLKQPPQIKHTVKVSTEDGDQGEIQVTYRILTKAELDAIGRDRIGLAFTVADGARAPTDEARTVMMDRLSDEHRERITDLLKDRIVDWDIQDEAGNPWPATPENVSHLVKYQMYFDPLYEGLIEASRGAARKNG